MDGPRQFHRGATVVLSALMGVIGVALIVQAVDGHGGAISGRMLLGILFVAAGIGRVWVQVRTARHGVDVGEATPAAPEDRHPVAQRNGRRPRGRRAR